MNCISIEIELAIPIKLKNQNNNILKFIIIFPYKNLINHSHRNIRYPKMIDNNPRMYPESVVVLLSVLFVLLFELFG